jgi:hypothetical protein
MMTNDEISNFLKDYGFRRMGGKSCTWWRKRNARTGDEICLFPFRKDHICHPQIEGAVNIFVTGADTRHCKENFMASSPHALLVALREAVVNGIILPSAKEIIQRKQNNADFVAFVRDIEHKEIEA